MAGIGSKSRYVIISIALAVLPFTTVTAQNFVAPNIEAMRLAIEDLIATHGDAEYPGGVEYLKRLDAIVASFPEGKPTNPGQWKQLFDLRREALVNNHPLLNFEKLLYLKRNPGKHGLPVNHKCNTGIPPTGYGSELQTISPPRTDGRIETLFKPKGDRYVGESDLHFDGDRLMFTMTEGSRWHLWEMPLDENGKQAESLRRITPDEESVDFFDGCYLPDGGIMLASTASFTAVPCWHGKERACSIYRIEGDGSGLRQICFDQDLDLHPAVMESGQVMFSRWDYTGIMHIYLRPLMAMNPDGTGQRALYGTNSYWPNSLFYPRRIPGHPNLIVAIASGYHGVPRMGDMVLIDTTRGDRSVNGIVQRIPGRGKPVIPYIKDAAVNDHWPKMLHPYPLSDKYFLVAGQINKNARWRIYLVDVFDNMIPIVSRDDADLFEPIPLRATKKPPAIPQRIDPAQNEATVYLHNIYAGPGLEGVPRGAVKRLRVIAYNFGYPGLAGPDKIGCGGPWEVMRILGTVPVSEDGSCAFTVPARTPIALQPLDDRGAALQLMRSWFTPQPGEVVSCVGCHEQSRSAPLTRFEQAAVQIPVPLTPWKGPARGSGFERETKPVLAKSCGACHDGRDDVPLDLRDDSFQPDYKGRPLTKLGSTRLHPEHVKRFGGGRFKYTAAYEALVPYIRRVNVEDEVNLLTPGEYHADTSELIQRLRVGHRGKLVDDDALDRLITWIDLNGPCHGSWTDAAPVPDGAVERRLELARLYGGLSDDLEEEATRATTAALPDQPRRLTPVGQTIYEGEDWPFSAREAIIRQKAHGDTKLEVTLDDSTTLRLRRIPAGRFVIDNPMTRRDAFHEIEQPFWIAETEITADQLRLFDPDHHNGRFTKRYVGRDGPGLPLEGTGLPAVRVSHETATAFCRWLSEKTGRRFSLPTVAQWQWSAVAGSNTGYGYGAAETDFSKHENLADLSLALPPGTTGGLESNISAHFGAGILASAVFGSNIVCDARYNDGYVATSPIRTFAPNRWGLYDMGGNISEWTATSKGNGRYIACGGSWCDRPALSHAGRTVDYPSWQRVHNVGFRVICEE